MRAVPEPNSTETTETGSIVTWSFGGSDFFPDGVLLSCVAVVPVDDTQRRLFGEVVLRDGERMKRYVSLLQGLSQEDREAALAKLRESVERETLAPFAEYARSELGKDWNPDAEDQPPLGELLLRLQGLGKR